MNKITVPYLQEMKKQGEKIAVITAYDTPTARLVDKAGIDIVLVGDSLGNVIQGRENTLPVSMDEMVYHTKIVSRGIKRAHLCADMPFMSYQTSKLDAVKNASRLIKEANAHSVKLEITEDYLDTITEIVKTGIPVMAHIGLRPQNYHQMGGYKVQGRTKSEANKLVKLAKSIEQAGAYALVLESIPIGPAKRISESIKIPTIGIGAGKYCDGQVLVFHDMLGISPEPLPRFVKKYAELNRVITDATKEYINDIKTRKFPKKEHGYE